MNSRARWNLCFANHDQEPNYDDNPPKGRIINFDGGEIPLTNILKKKIIHRESSISNLYNVKICCEN